jgi:hypothetical protein
MDLSPVVAWSTVVIGSIVTWRYGNKLNATEASGIFIKSALVSISLGLGLTIVASAMHGICIEISMCTNSGDGNMGYWFHSFFAIPLFLIIALSRAHK